MTPEDAHKKSDEFATKLGAWANEDTDVLMEIMCLMAGKGYVTKRNRKFVARFVIDHIDFLAAVIASLRKQRETMQLMRGRIDSLEGYVLMLEDFNKVLKRRLGMEDE